MVKNGWKSKTGKIFAVLLTAALVLGDGNMTAFAKTEQSGQETGYEEELLLEDVESSECAIENPGQSEDGQETAEDITEAGFSDGTDRLAAGQGVAADAGAEEAEADAGIVEEEFVSATEDAAAEDSAEPGCVLTEEAGQTSALPEISAKESQQEDYETVEEETLFLASSEENSSNYQNLQNESNCASTVKSYLVYLENGTYMRVDGSYDRLLVEYYNKAFQKTSSKSIAMQQPIFGGFYAGDGYYYVAYGKKNADQSDDNVVMEVVKYDTDWKEIMQVKITGQNTYNPFEAGSLRMTEYGGYLYIRAAHTMYSGTDGLHHQANWTLQVRESDMTLMDSYSSVGNISVGYVSHSFNQFILVDDSQNLVTLDHGDSYPRGIVLGRYATKAGAESFRSSYESQIVLAFKGNSGNNFTGASLGGFEYSKDNYLVAGTAAAQDDDWNTHTARNVFVSVTSKSNLSDNKLTYITGYEDSDNKTVTTPHLVKVSDDSFLLLWGIRTVSQKSVYTETGTIGYVFLDGNGNKTSKIFTGKGYLSDCEPIVADGKVVWYTTYNGQIAHYLIDSEGNLSASAVLGEGDESGAATGSYFESSLNAATTATIAKQYYTSKAIVPSDDAVTLIVGGNQLKQGTDYTITCTDNTEVGTAVAVLTGIGKYQDSVTVKFKIAVRPLSMTKVDSSEFVTKFEYDGEQKCPKFKLYMEVDGEKVYLVEDQDYFISYNKNISAGTANVKLTGKGNYSGTKSRNFKITKYDITDSEEFAVSVSSDYIYQKGGLSKTLKEEVVVTFKGRQLKIGTDYSIACKNMNPSKSSDGYALALLTVKGKGSYAGKKELAIKIHAKDLAETVMTAEDVVYKEKAGNYKCTPVLLDTNGKKLSKGKDYDKTFTYYVDGKELSKDDTVPVGTEVTVVVSYKDGSMYKGTASTTYRVVASNISKAKVSCVNEVITVTLDGIILTEGKDYEIVSKEAVNNTSNYKIILHGLGSYGKTKKVTVRRKYQ